MWYSSSAGTLCPSGHNSDSSQVWFDVGDRYFGDIELAEPIEEEGSAAVVPNLSPHGMEVYVVDEPSSARLFVLGVCGGVGVVVVQAMGATGRTHHVSSCIPPISAMASIVDYIDDFIFVGCGDGS